MDKLKKLLSFVQSMEDFDAKELLEFKELLPKLAEKLESLLGDSTPHSPISHIVPSNGLISASLLTVGPCPISTFHFIYHF